MTKKVPIKGGAWALVDECDYMLVMCYRWSRHSSGYAVAYDPALYAETKDCNKALVLMHRLIMNCGTGDKQVVDHLNHNGLDNRRANLQVKTNRGNMLNRRNTIREGFSSEYRGVNARGDKDGCRINSKGYKCKMKNPWSATYCGRYLGVFETERAAALAYDAEAMRDQGDEAQLNFPKEHSYE